MQVDIHVFSIRIRLFWVLNDFFTGVSAQTITLTSENNQETTRGKLFPAVTFTVTDSGSAVQGQEVILGTDAGTTDSVRISTTQGGPFETDLTVSTDANGEVTIYVRANPDSLYDTCLVVGAIIAGSSTQLAEFKGRITDVLYFPSDATTRSISKGAAADTNIGDPVSATHWRTDVRLTYSLEGTDAALFRIDASTGQLKTKAGVNYNTKNTYSVTVKVKEENGGVVRSSDTISITINPPKQPKRRIIIQACPIGWVRSDRFGGRTQRVLLYAVKLKMDLQNRISIYQPDYVAIYVHPDEALENLDGWKLQVAIPYNYHRDYLLTAENAVVVDANIEGVEGGFAFIENPEEDPFPMVGMGFTGALVPGFDYRLYDERGRKVDFGIACYKQAGIFQALRDMEDPKVLRKVLLESLDWDAATYIRSEWTVPAPAPAAPSLVKKTIVGTWADLKKQ
ncbi:MAG: hypothetical protein OXU27_12730 [Candidatus Poribacteria bacterium]|nr:hypothetical protein [Candidatus Poribacteria bacterium]